jgi:hypothetical protein
MKKILLIINAFLILGFFSSCIKNDEKVFTGDTVVEFDATVLNTPATGKAYPLLTRVPGYGRPVFTSTPPDPGITRTSGTIKFRVNLVGPQSAKDQVINYRVVDAESTAVAGTHYTTGTSFSIPANSSFGEISINVLNPGVTGTAKTLVIELLGNNEVKPSANYKFLGLSIAQN